jgi:hypothetical protein
MQRSSQYSFESKKYPGSGSENNLRESIPGHLVVARQFSIWNFSNSVSSAVCKFVSILDVNDVKDKTKNFGGRFVSIHQFIFADFMCTWLWQMAKRCFISLSTSWNAFIYKVHNYILQDIEDCLLRSNARCYTTSSTKNII